jgi:hypothetical protein
MKIGWIAELKNMLKPQLKNFARFSHLVWRRTSSDVFLLLK